MGLSNHIVPFRNLPLLEKLVETISRGRRPYWRFKNGSRSILPESLSSIHISRRNEGDKAKALQICDMHDNIKKTTTGTDSNETWYGSRSVALGSPLTLSLIEVVV
jgi:hypothetical protein